MVSLKDRPISTKGLVLFSLSEAFLLTGSLVPSSKKELFQLAAIAFPLFKGRHSLELLRKGRDRLKAGFNLDR